ncbi:MAG TPA: cytochrome c3 family protein [Acidobacteriota bacterium]|nr:cytochrome c3 family protein [Acidobacteriota bacterium]
MELPRRRSNIRFIGMVLVTAILISGSAYAIWNWSSRVQQPIQFNHRKHAAQMECSACHVYYSQGAHSGLPDADVCSACHSDAIGKSPEEAKLRSLLAEGKPLAFRKLFHLPDHVYYSHRRHVVLGKLECVRCHGGIADTEAPPSRPLVNITMDYCVQCHERSKVTTDCNSCHR